MAAHATPADVKAALATWLKQQSRTDAGQAAIGECFIPTLATLLDCAQAQADAAWTLANVLADKIPAHKDAFREADGIPRLVAILSTVDPSSQTAENAIRAVGLAVSYDDKTVHAANADAFAAAGGIASLVLLLSADATTNLGRCAAAATLGGLAYDNINRKAAIRDAGAIPPLVSLLSAEFMPLARVATYALLNLAASTDTRMAICDAGAIPPLVALLARAGVDANMLRRVDDTLARLAHVASDTIFEATVAATPPLAKIPLLATKLRPIADTRLQRAEAGEDSDALRSAIAAAEYLNVDAASVARALARLDAMTGEANWYHLNLKKRIGRHDEELLQAAEMAAGVATAAARAESGGAAGSSSALGSSSDPAVLEADVSAVKADEEPQPKRPRRS